MLFNDKIERGSMTGWGYAIIKIYTHAINGLSKNDFILASKIDQISNV